MKSVEGKKKLKYMERILNEEYGTLTPIVFSLAGEWVKKPKLEQLWRNETIFSAAGRVDLKQNKCILARNISLVIREIEL